MQVKGFITYRIWYGNYICYVGRTKQPLQQRMHAHFHAKGFTMALDIHLVSKIEYCEWQTEADMNLAEIYYIASLKPAINRDDKPKDDLTIIIDEFDNAEWHEFVPSNWDKWLIECANNIPKKYSKVARNKKAIKKMKELEEENTLSLLS